MNGNWPIPILQRVGKCESDGSELGLEGGAGVRGSPGSCEAG